MESLKKKITDGIKGTNFFIDTRNDDSLSFLIRSKGSDNILSVAYYRGECTAMHGRQSEFPSILPQMKGKPSRTIDFIAACSAEEIIDWLKTEKFYETL
jgi:hypothetical protein